jgi:hypothetical protein
MTIGDFFVTKGKDVDLFFQEVALMKQLILEHTHPLELLRELISNAGAQQIGAKNIHITEISREYFLGAPRPDTF